MVARLMYYSPSILLVLFLSWLCFGVNKYSSVVVVAPMTKEVGDDYYKGVLSLYRKGFSQKLIENSLSDGVLTQIEYNAIVSQTGKQRLVDMIKGNSHE